MHLNKGKSIIKRVISSLLVGSLALSSITIPTVAEEVTTTIEDDLIASTGITVTVDENGNVISSDNTTVVTDSEEDISDNSIDVDNTSSTTDVTTSNTEEPIVDDNDSYDSTPESTSSGTDPPADITFDKYYSLIDDNVIQTKMLFVQTSNNKIFTANTNVISNYDDVYIIDCASIEEARYVYSYYVDKVDYITDLSNVIALASNTTSTNSNSETVYDDAISQLNDIDTKNYSGYIALIDTGASGADASLSVVDDDGTDYNGHGTSMLNYIREENPTAKILSIKAFEDRATNAANLYAAIKLAINSKVSVINLSIAGYDIEKNAIIKDVIQEALDNGITVIGAAGNYNTSALNFIPGCIDGVKTVGAINSDKTKYNTSNYNADVYVVANSTSEATARYTGMFTANNIDESIITYSVDEDKSDSSTEDTTSSTDTHSDKKAA